MRRTEDKFAARSDIEELALLSDRNISQEPGVEFLPVSGLKPLRRNPRSHSAKQIRQIADSIRQFGFTNPILSTATAASSPGTDGSRRRSCSAWNRVPTICLDRLSEAQKRAYILPTTSSPRTLAGIGSCWRSSSQYISKLDIEFDLTITGFETAEIDLLIEAPDGARIQTMRPTTSRNSTVQADGHPARRPLAPGRASSALRRCHQGRIIQRLS